MKNHFLGLVATTLCSFLTLSAAQADEQLQVPRYLYCVGLISSYTHAATATHTNPSSTPIFEPTHGPDSHHFNSLVMKMLCHMCVAKKDQIPALVKNFYDKTPHIPLTNPRAIFKIDTSELKGKFDFEDGYYFTDRIYLDAIVEVTGIESPESTL